MNYDLKAAKILNLPPGLVNVRFVDGDRMADYQIGYWECRVLTEAGYWQVQRSEHGMTALFNDLSDWVKRAESQTWLAGVREWAAGREVVAVEQSS